jgi:hypothetical protein
MLDPTPELPDDTLIGDVEFPARIRNVLVAAGLKTVGEVRNFGRYVAQLSRLRQRLRRPTSRNAGSAVDRWGSTLGQKANLVAEFSVKQFPAGGNSACVRLLVAKHFQLIVELRLKANQHRVDFLNGRGIPERAFDGSAKPDNGDFCLPEMRLGS